MQRKSFIAACAAGAAVAALPMTSRAAETSYDLITPTGTIFGTVLVPERPRPVPVALIIAGSGPIDRNGNAPTLPLNMYSKLAAALAEGGIASIRYDKRGIAASHAAARSESDVRFEDFADDAAAWIAKAAADRRFSRVAIIGHSEGSLLGMLAVQRAPVAAYVSLEGPGFPVASVLRTQLRPQLAAYPALAAKSDMILESLSNGKTVSEADVPAELMSLYHPSVQPFLISMMKYDPRSEIAKLTTRVTIVQGSHDVQVPVPNGEALAAALPSATYAPIAGLTHVLTDDPSTDLAGQLAGAYADASRPLDTTLVRTLIAAVA